MDGVSLGWCQISVDETQGVWLNDKRTAGNDWVKPSEPELVTDYLNEVQVPYNLNIYAATGQSVTLPDGTKTDAVSAILLYPEHRTKAVALLAEASEGYAGLTMDIEGMKGDELKGAYTVFMTELRAALPPEKTLYVCVQPDTWYTGFDYRALGELCDKVILMAHAYQWTSVPAGYVGGSNTNTPVTPLPEIYRALRNITHPETGVQDPSKLALAISFANVGLEVDTEGNLASTDIYRPAIDTVWKRMNQETTRFGYSDLYRNPYLYYEGDEDNYYHLWYENEQSVRDKIELARLFGITGVSLWRLGTIPTFQGETLEFDVWSELMELRGENRT